MLHYWLVAGEWKQWHGGQIGDIVYPGDIVHSMEPEQIAALGLRVPTPLVLIPGSYATNIRAIEQDGELKLVADWETIPDPEPADNPLTKFQLRKALSDSGRGARFVENLINGLPESPQKDDAIIWYETNQIIEWNNPFTQMLMELSGIPLEERRALWIAGTKL